MPWDAAKLAQKRANSAKLAGHPNTLSGKQKATALKDARRQAAEAAGAMQSEAASAVPADPTIALQRIAQWPERRQQQRREQAAAPSAASMASSPSPPMPTLDYQSAEGISLMALNSKMCALTTHATFEPLDPEGIDVPVTPSGASGSRWTQHTLYHIPNDPSTRSQSHLSSGTLSEVHRFRLDDPHPLNERLVSLALQMEASTEHACVSKSNVGGFQSRADLFTVFSSAIDSRQRSTCRQLHGIVSAALDELCAPPPALAQAPPPFQGGEAMMMPTPRSEGGSGDDADAASDSDAPQHGAQTEPQHLLDDQSAVPFAWPWRTGRPPLAEPLLLREACAWFNVNRASDSNLLHVHHPARWSAVYFVSAGPVEGPRHAPAGHLVFRGGRKPSSGRGGSSNTYFAVPPEPGCLWLFPGSMPHCVFPFEQALDDDAVLDTPRTVGDHDGTQSGTVSQRGQAAGRSAAASSPPRISVAINAEDAVPPPVYACDLCR
jgi:hypothetical protein